MSGGGEGSLSVEAGLCAAPHADPGLRDLHEGLQLVCMGLLEHSSFARCPQTLRALSSRFCM